MKARWHIQRTPGQVVLSRQLPARFDIAADSFLPCAQSDALSLTRLAHQIRQDLWRALQSLRGFSPVVQITEQGQGLQIRAGGRAPAPRAATLPDRILEVLEDPARQARWLRHAARNTRGVEAGVEAAARTSEGGSND